MRSEPRLSDLFFYDEVKRAQGSVLKRILCSFLRSKKYGKRKIVLYLENISGLKTFPYRCGDSAALARVADDMYLGTAALEAFSQSGAGPYAQSQNDGIRRQNHGAVILRPFQCYGLFFDGKQFVAGVYTRVVGQDTAELVISDSTEDAGSHLISHLDDGDGETAA